MMCYLVSDHIKVVINLTWLVCNFGWKPPFTYLLVIHPSCWKMASLLTSSTVNKSAESSSSFSWQTISGIVNGLSVFVKCLCVSLCVGYLLSFSDTALDLLTVSPGKLMPPNFWIWTLLTHCLIEVCIYARVSHGFAVVELLTVLSKSRLVCLFGAGIPRLSWKTGHWTIVDSPWANNRVCCTHGGDTRLR